MIYIYQDLNEWSEYCELWQDICYEIREQLKKMRIQTEEVADYFADMDNAYLPWIRMSRSVKKIFRYLSEINIKTILVLDEFDNAASLF